MPNFNNDESQIDLADLQRDVSALVAEVDRAGKAIETGAQAGDAADNTAVAPTTAPTATAVADADEPHDPAPIVSDDVEDAVDELIADAIDAVDALDDQLDAAPADAHDEEAVVAVAEQVEELVNETSRAAAGEPHELAATEPANDGAPAEPAEEESEPVNRAEAEPAQPVMAIADAESTHADADTIADLDAAIETEADAIAEDDLDELEGEFESVEQVTSRADENNSSPAPTNEPDAADAPTDAPAAPPAASPVQTPADAEQAPTGPAPAPTPAPATAAIAPTEADTNVGLVAKALAPLRSARAIALNPTTLARVERLLLRPLSRPLARLDPRVRDTIGWVGVNTLFIAICLWLFLILH